ncbi:MAG: enoyl-CoA hydratase-related protein [Chloroflexota bacterium]
MAYSHITINIQDSIAEIVLNHPERRNPLSVEMIEQLTCAFKEMRANEAVFGIILSAAGPTFCSGHDFKDMVGQPLAPMRDLMQSCSELMQLIHVVPQPVVAKVQGLAVGAGCQLALTCDLVVASEQASFRTPGGAGGWFCFTPMVAVTRAVGRKRALEMLLAGDPISAELASEWGMINRVVSADALDAETWDLMTRVTRGSRLLKGMGKQAFYNQVEQDEAKAYEYAAEIMAATGTMPDPQERMLAFVEKRKPMLNQM